MTTDFDPAETHDLYLTLAQYILPRLKFFAEDSIRLPDRMNHQEWNTKVQAMIRAFELVLRDGVETQEEQHAIEKGLREFAKHYRDLWS